MLALIRPEQDCATARRARDKTCLYLEGFCYPPLTGLVPEAEHRNRSGSVDRTYDIFEVLPDGNRLWREAVKGHELAVSRLKALAGDTQNEFLLMHVPTKTVIAVLPATHNAPRARGAAGEA